MNSILNRIWENKFSFLTTFFLIFTLSYIVLVAIDFLPEKPAHNDITDDSSAVTPGEESVKDEVYPNNSVDSLSTDPAEAAEDIDLTIGVSAGDELPVSIYISKLDKTVQILNPTSRTIADLDAALLDGVVRHPDSATLSQDGNVFILGHSSYLPNVFNNNFQAFNGIQNLEWGDLITIYSEDSVYEYRVEKVYRAKAQDVTVPIAGTGKMLTLATCNSFGSTDDRYIVESKLMSVKPL